MNAEPAVLAAIIDLVRAEAGIVLPRARTAAILAAVDRAAPGVDPGTFARLATGPAGRDLLDRLINELTVQETSFVRDRRQLDTIPWRRLLESARAAGSPGIRVWSVGCASGEEAYTLALLAAEALAAEALAAEALAAEALPAPVDVLGTDISIAALAAADRARYGDRAVRGLEPSLRARYLDRQADGSYLVRERLHDLVRFRRHNLARDPAPPAGETIFDLITCRNVLIYFDVAVGQQVIGALERSLRPGGILLLGAADALQRAPRSPGLPGRRPEDRARAPAPGRRRAHEPASALTREQRLDAAMDAADKGDRDGALRYVDSLLADDSLDGDAHFIDGLVWLEAGQPARAAAALRRALCADAAFALAAFTLGRACDALGDEGAARRAYEQALRTFDPADHRHERILQQIDIGDIATACRVRLAMRSARSGAGRPSGNSAGR